MRKTNPLSVLVRPVPLRRSYRCRMIFDMPTSPLEYKLMMEMLLQENVAHLEVAWFTLFFLKE